MATPVTPVPGENSVVATGGIAVVAAGPNPNGGFITNPAGASASLFVNPVTDATLTAGGTNFELRPGQNWDLIPGQTTPTSVNAADDAHVFCIVVF